MNINKWRVVRHQFHKRPLMYPWHVYPTGVIPATEWRDLSALYNEVDDLNIRATYAEAIAHAHQKATAQNL